MTARMRAAWYERNGPAEDVLVVGECDMPQIGDGDVLVRIESSGVNPSDVKSRAGRPLAFDRIIPHSDGAGTITQVGSKVSSARIGQRVWIWNGQWRRPMGTCAEFIAVPEAQAVALPDHISFDAGACLGIPALTAWQAIDYLGDIHGQKILVIGAANAVGAYCTQMAALKGAHVIGTVGNSQKAQLAKDLGAADVINYKLQSTSDEIARITDGQGVDAMIDMDFSTLDPLIASGALKRHGTIACYGSNGMGQVSFDFRTWLYYSINLRLFLVYDLTLEQRHAALSGLTELLTRDKLKHQIGARFSLQEVAKAHQAVQSGSYMGNVIVTPATK